MEAKEIMVNCSFCGKEIPCINNMVKLEKHACFECFATIKDKLDPKEIDRVHVAIPKDKLTNYAMQKIFPEFWSDHQAKFHEMSKKEAAEEAFLAGASIIISLKEDFEKEMSRNKP